MSTKLNITMEQGAEFASSFSMADAAGDPLDMSPYTGTSQMRKHYSSANSVTFAVTLASNGGVTLSLPSAQTSLVNPGRYLYTVDVTDTSNGVFRIIEGIVTVTPNMIRES